MIDATSSLRKAGTLGHVVVGAMRRWAPRTAIVAGDVRLTYAELGHRIARALTVFESAGLTRGAAIGIVGPNGVDVIVATAAAAVAGIRTTPLSMLASDEDFAWIIADAEIGTVIAAPAIVERLARAAPDCRVIGLDTFSAMIDAAEPGALTVVAQHDDIAVIGYTGGTTGRPKGVVHTHGSAYAAVGMATAEWEWPEELRVLAVTPVSHAAGILAYPTWLKGGEFHLLPGFVPDGFADYICAERVTATFLVPTMIYRLLDAGLRDLGPLKTVLYGAAPIAVDRLVEAIGRFGPIFMQLYGQTEAPTCVSYLARGQHDPAQRERLGSCGIPLSGVEVALLDAEDRAVEVGEICVRGPLVMKGYWRRPEETAAALRGGWLRTGDIGRFDAEGCLHIVDRTKDMIITGGVNIYPRDIEDVIVELPGVAACAVVGLPDPIWGECVTAAIVADGEPPSAEAVTAAVRERRGATAAPKRVVIVDALPVTLVGKIDKLALRVQLMAA